jgi:hypothetical protein
MADRRLTSRRRAGATPVVRVWLALLLILGGGVLCGCGSRRSLSRESALPAELVSQARPIGRGTGFHPPARGPVIGECRSQLGRRIGAHVEVFAANRVVLLASGIGTLPPRTFSAGRISRAGCYGDLVTLEPTGVVQMRPGARVRVSDLFRSWGQPLSSRRLGPFAAEKGRQVEVFVDGRRWRGSPGDVVLVSHDEIVLEVGPHVPPHRSYTFPPGT